MPQASPFQTSFSSGELSPRVSGRVDLNKYASAVETMENWIGTIQGPAFYRSGTRFVSEVLDSDVKSRLIPFVFSDDQAYIFEFANNKIRIYTLEAPSVVTGFNFPLTDVDVAGDFITISDYSYSENQGPFQFTTTGTLPGNLNLATDYYILRVNANDFQVSLTLGGAFETISSQGTGTHTITPQGSLLQEIDTTYPEADLYGIQFAQSANVIYFAHPLHAPTKIERISTTQWRHTTVSFYDGPYDDPNITAITMTPSSSALGAITVTASADVFVVGRDEGRLIRIGNTTIAGGAWGYGQITLVQSPTLVDVNLLRILSRSTFAETDWRLGSWYPGNYPRAITFHEQRLVFAGDGANPQKFYGSVIADFENFAPTGGPIHADVTPVFTESVAVDNAYSFVLASDRVNVISWVNSIRNLLVGTVGGIWPVQATSSLEVISPGNINVRRSSTRGASPVLPVNVQDATIFLNRTARRVMEVAYSFESDSFTPSDLTIIADHVSDAEIIELEYASDQESIVWGARSDGVLVGLTLDRELGVGGWHRHVMGGVLGTGNAQVESIAVIPAPDGSVSPGAHENEKHDQLWMIVRRRINGVDTRMIEFMEDRFPISADIEDAFFVDAGSTYDGAPTMTLSGLDHLEGETVKVLADGAVHPDRTVSSGSITLSRSTSKAHVGLGYTGTIKTLRLEGAGSQGTSHGKLKRVTSVVVRLDRSLGLQLANTNTPVVDSDWDPVLLRSGADPMDSSPPLFSGDTVMSVDNGWSLEGQLAIRQVDPLPATLLALGFRSESTERGSE